MQRDRSRQSVTGPGTGVTGPVFALPGNSQRPVLSVFPGADLLGKGFELEGYCVLRGPDLVWGGDVRTFNPSRNVFCGVIGGPPCQDFSRLRRCDPTGQGMAMLQEFARIVMEAGPDWFLMENVPGVPCIAVPGYTVQRFNLKASECGATQARLRCFQFGSLDGLPLVIARGKARAGLSHAALATEGRRTNRRSWADFCELQGLPRDFDLPGLNVAAKYRAVGNGVPVQMARVIAGSILRRRVTAGQRLCICNCGRPVKGNQRMATDGCRKRMQRQRRDAAAVTKPGIVTPGTARQEIVFPDAAQLDTRDPIAINGDAYRRPAPFPAMLDDYPGAKNGAGVFQTIINQMPPHDVYIEAFLGSGAVLRRKRPAQSTIAIDVDGAVIEAWKGCHSPELQIVHGDAIEFLRSYQWTGREVVYADPPYLRQTRSCQRNYYRHELATPAQHMELITVLKAIPAYVILSGYPSDLYDHLFADWRVVTYQTMTHRGRKVTECLWMNFPEPFELHDYRYLGSNFRERRRIKRKKARWKARLLKMDVLERCAVLEAIAEARTARLGKVEAQQFPLPFEAAASAIPGDAEGADHNAIFNAVLSQTPKP